MESSITFRFPEIAVTESSERIPESPNSLASSSDEMLIVQIGEGSREALAVLFTRYARLVRGTAYRVLRDAAEADDLLQDVFVLIQRLCTNFDASKGSARFWILQMTYRRAISRRRYLTSRHFYEKLDVTDLPEELGDGESHVERLDNAIDGELRAAALREVFNSLSENQQKTLRLFFVEGCTFDEIAAKLGQSKGNIKHHYFRGLERLRKHVFSGKPAAERAV